MDIEIQKNKKFLNYQYLVDKNQVIQIIQSNIQIPMKDKTKIKIQADNHLFLEVPCTSFREFLINKK